MSTHEQQEVVDKREDVEMSGSARESTSDKIRVTDQEASDKGAGGNVRIIEGQGEAISGVGDEEEEEVNGDNEEVVCDHQFT